MLVDLLPAAATTVVPRPIASSMADWTNGWQVTEDDNERLMTSAGLGLAGIPGTSPPEAQVMAAATSDIVPPHLPSARTGRIRASGAMPAIPLALFGTAAASPATCVPCQDDAVTPHPSNSAGWFTRSAASTQSPSSRGSESRPSPSLATTALSIRSAPGKTRPTRSSWAVIPVSITAMTSPAPVARFHAGTAITSPSDHWSSK